VTNIELRWKEIVLVE